MSRDGLIGLVNDERPKYLALFNSKDSDDYDIVCCAFYNTMDETLEFIEEFNLDSIRVFRVGKEFDDKELNILKEVTGE